jgi:hypothetical protein
MASSSDWRIDLFITEYGISEMAMAALFLKINEQECVGRTPLFLQKLYVCSIMLSLTVSHCFSLLFLSIFTKIKSSLKSISENLQAVFRWMKRGQTARELAISLGHSESLTNQELHSIYRDFIRAVRWLGRHISRLEGFALSVNDLNRPVNN